MTDSSDAVPDLPIPRTDDQVFDLIHPFPMALAAALGATAHLDEVITAGEYQTLAQATDGLDELTPYPGLMQALVLRSLLGDSAYGDSLRELKKSTTEIPEEQRVTVFRAVAPLIEAQPGHREKIGKEWAAALRVDESIEPKGPATPSNLFGSLVAAVKGLITREDSQLEKARWFASAFDDERLEQVVTAIDADPKTMDEVRLREELGTAVERAFERASEVMKSPVDLERQIEAAKRFLATAEALLEQIRLRLVSVKDRLTLQNEMFEEDLDAFVRKSLDSVEIGMRDLMAGRSNWTDPSIWKQFSDRGAAQEILAEFEPLKRRYERIFEQWHRELQSFSREIGTVRSGVLRHVDPQAFQSLVPTRHTGASILTALDRAADTTLGLAFVGAAGAAITVAATAATAGGVVIAIVSNPIGWAVGAAVLSSGAWKVFSNPEARKRKVAKSKRQALEEGLRKLLAEQALDHEDQAQTVMEGFLKATFNEYGPLIIEARMAALRAKLEVQVVERVLADTRKALEPAA